MAQKTNLTTQAFHFSSLLKPMLLGGGFALILIVFFLLDAGKPNPEWGKLWMIKPLIIVPLAGASGAAFYGFINHLFGQKGWMKILAVIFGLFAYLVAIWLGTVLGLNGTYWN